jgi:lysophospholipase L1-like esterase
VKLRLEHSGSLISSALVLGGILAALAIGEGCFRWVVKPPPNQDRWYHPYLITGDFISGANPTESPEAAGYRKTGLSYLYHPEAPVSGIEARGDYFFGERRGLAQPDPSGRRKRIMILGGSLALGDGVKDRSRTWTRLLERELRARLRSEQIEVLTVATRSFVSTQERLALELFVLPKKPDAVVFLDGFNDMSALLHLARPGDPYNMGTLYARYYSIAFQLLRWASDHSALIRYFVLKEVGGKSGEAFRAIAADSALTERYGEGIARVYNDNIKRMSRRCMQEKVPCFFFFQPNRPLTDSYRGLTSEMPVYARISQRMLETVRSEGSFSAGSRFKDLTHLLDQRPDVYVDRVHFSEEGQEILARAVAERLLSSRVFEGHHFSSQ